MRFTLTINMDETGILDASDVALELRKLADLLIDTHNANNSELPLAWDPYDKSGSILADGKRVGQWEFLPGSAPIIKAVR